MKSEGRSPVPGAQDPTPCPMCRGEGVERRWRYDERASALDEISRTCGYCGGSGKAPPRVDLRPDAPPPGWAWEMGSLV